MIGKLFANDGANAVLVVALSGAVATLVAHGPGRASLGRVLSGVLSNPIPRPRSSGAQGLSSAASGRRTAA
ncbi:MAG: hypothetical protein H0U91_01215 [Rubrobacter sp.]|jgi:hypothetical protein|nr:hypothetical protein [Rubrobacter sp.]MBA3952933.1 hypothetical protein [Rubrobacter sp.]MDQ3360547.1 hypothetical protein [Actinomycetota bacterium]MDQ3376994.1 hypothetical protein [Actinomycetota bacterium]